ncbi:MAG TPA: hypothetical protein PL017_09395, partial [Tenuifilaceae bacterium]|nr:hypothetical protein [Tenuifilaceae bacterium]HPQ34723.1 hypothetical protein [Tenuifilaceae bacterium]
MKMFVLKTFLIFLVLSVHFGLYSQTTKTVGTGGDYTTLNHAIEDINNGTVTGEIILSVVSNLTETNPTIILPSGQGSTNYTSLTIRPEAQNIEIAANFASPIVTIDGAENISIDGRIGSIGSEINLTIKNTGGSAILLENDASNNTILFCYLKGSSTSTTEGIITVFSGAEGCDNLLIHNCRIGDESLTTSYGIYSVNGGGGSNSNITISNSTIFNFGIDVQLSAGIYLDANNSDITISENHIFQTNAITLLAQKEIAGILSYSSNNITISNNFIGGENAGCAGNPWSVSGSFPATFKGILIDGQNTDQSTIEGNTIKNFSWETQLSENTLSSPGIWCGIYYGGGIIDISNNVIGSGSNTGDIVVHFSGNYSGISYGISGGESGTNISISENEIGGINVLSTSTDYSHNFTGIENVGATEVAISNNTIGSTTTSQSIATLTQSTCSAEGQNLTGITNNANTTSCTIEGNTIANLYNATESNINAASNNAHQVRGIAALNGTNQIIENTIYNLSTTSSSIDSEGDASALGISIDLNIPNQIISNNLIYNLTNTSAETGLDVTGIFYYGASTGSNEISNNTLYNLVASTTNSSIKGIEIIAGRVDIVNNSISLGSSISEGLSIHGISKGVTASANLNFYFNSVYISGTVAASTTATTYAFFQNWSSSSDEVNNNIFMNTRTVTSGTGKNYAYYKNNTDVINLNYNCYYVTGTGTVLGLIGAVEKTDIPMITGLDQNSIVEAVSFTDPTNGNLHTSTTALNGKAVLVSSVTTDIDGNPRNPLLPDIGADEFTQPVIFDPGANLDFGWTDVLTPT